MSVIRPDASFLSTAFIPARMASAICDETSSSFKFPPWSLSIVCAKIGICTVVMGSLSTGLGVDFGVEESGEAVVAERASDISSLRMLLISFFLLDLGRSSVVILKRRGFRETRPH